ncbi:MAG: thiamine pyrophosphate-dependent dehydrogenase E1 component subunit alpha [Sphaerochaetaceae bacterium]|jgi:pyruvate dehydrogenase E1 component alpha subunit|nr:thiamine pyrophosphate-dependent dehydrogenase E1 component subunit alpha [Sphaerochaetaceae bacterium]MDX9938438.1 thiamine pyrophosphate-dependent dehydrogenase E1 component subunit alpha [Sphaerochaetaceae bacterium]
MKLPKAVHKELYYKMLLTREFEQTAAKLFIQGKVHGTAHFCIGEEATGVGVCSALEKEDLITQTHRGHNQGIGKNMDINRMMAEFLGKETGYCKGKGGCMHIADFSVGSLGANGVVAGGMPIATGAALAQKYRKSEHITVCFFGDGAANEGAFHESLNLASVWKLPVLFVCTNNQYGMSTSIKKSMNIEDISIRATSYGIKGIALDGNDVVNIYQETKKAKEHVKEHGPMLMVLNTYRWMGHSKSDAQLYRTKEEVEQWKEQCPIKRHRAYLLENGIFTEKELDAVQQEAADAVRAAVEFAENSPEPKIENIFDDVYAD